MRFLQEAELVAQHDLVRTPNDTMKALDKKDLVIRNAHTKAEMKVIEQEFADHKGPFLTIKQALELAKATQTESPLSHEK